MLIPFSFQKFFNKFDSLDLIDLEIVLHRDFSLFSSSSFHSEYANNQFF